MFFNIKILQKRMRHLKLMKSLETSGALNILWRLGENWDYEYKMLFTASFLDFVQVSIMGYLAGKIIYELPY